MSLIHLIVILALTGALVWAIVTYIPMAAGIKRAIIVITIICLVAFVLYAFGILDDIHEVKVPKI